MGNIVDDIRANEDTFADRPFNEVDSLALAQLSYARMPVNVPRLDAEAMDVDLAMVGVRDLLRAECYDDMFGKVWSPSMNVDLLRAMCESPRWRDLRVGGYVDEFDPETTKQFSACVFDVGDGSSYVAFRGTDSTIVGWKEDFAMAFRRPVAAQESAARYLADIAGRRDGPLMVGGHSKGGNLAVYAAANAPAAVQE
ncbi:Mbeg1-like protein, partial [Bifidobacterium bifidum]